MPFLPLPVQKEASPWTLFMVINLAFGLAKYIRMISLYALLECRITKCDSGNLSLTGSEE